MLFGDIFAHLPRSDDFIHIHDIATTLRHDTRFISSGIVVCGRYVCVALRMRLVQVP